MKKHIILLCVLSVGCMQGADIQRILKLQSSDGQEIELTPALYNESKTLRDIVLDIPVQNEKVEAIPIDRFTGDELSWLPYLLSFASSYKIKPPYKPSLNDLIKYDTVIQLITASPFKKSYPYSHGLLIEIADFFNIPLIRTILGEYYVKPNLDLAELQAGAYPNANKPMQLAIADRLKEKRHLAQEKFLTNADTTDPYFKGVSIQGLIDHGTLPTILDGALDLRNKKIGSLTGIENIQGLENLQKLYLSHNQITAIPENIQGLENLQKLDLSDNQITAIPENIQGLENLQGLYLYNNQIRAIPESITGLEKLKELYLSHNQITAIPKNIQGLENLQVLYLSHNQITAIPENIQGLEKLKELDLERNPIPIQFIPNSVGKLQLASDKERLLYTR